MEINRPRRMTECAALRAPLDPQLAGAPDLSIGPREEYARLKKSPVMKAVDERPVWSVICFVVPSEYRGQGVAQALPAVMAGEVPL